jgi:hypothetical protein
MDYEVTMAGVIMRCVIVDYDVTVGAGYSMGDIILRGGDAVAVILLLISPTTRSALFPKIHLALPPFPSRGETCFYALKHGAYARVGNV